MPEKTCFDSLQAVFLSGTPDALGSQPANGALAKMIKRECLHQGLIIQTGGRHRTVLRLLPPLVVTNDALQEVAEKLLQGIKASVEQCEQRKKEMHD